MKTVAISENAPRIAAGAAERPSDADATATVKNNATIRKMLRLSTVRIVCIAPFHANASSGRPSAARSQPVDRTL